MPPVDYLSLEDLLDLARRLGVDKVRDLGLLDAAAHRPMTSLMGEDAYPSVEEKAAVLLESITRNHPLVDGNKRLGALALVVFCALNGMRLEPDDDQFYDTVIAVSTGHLTYHEVAARLREWTG
jgi:death-on-curing protein